MRQLKLAVLGNAEVNTLVASRPRFSVIFRASAFELLLGCLREIGEGSDGRLVEEAEFKVACAKASRVAAYIAYKPNSLH